MTVDTLPPWTDALKAQTYIKIFKIPREVTNL